MTDMRRILVLDGSAAGESAYGLAACVEHKAGRYTLLSCSKVAGKQAAEGIAGLAHHALDDAGWSKEAETAPHCVAVVVGPGSFTGLRASCAVAAGYALGLGVPVTGVTRGEALRPALEQTIREHSEQPLQGWLLVTAARKGRVFIETTEGVQAVSLADWIPPSGVWLVAGDAVSLLPAMPEGEVSTLAIPDAEQIAQVALARLNGYLPPRDALPVYVDPPEAKRPAGGLRSAPV